MNSLWKIALLRENSKLYSNAYTWCADSTKQEAETAWTSGIGSVVKENGGFLSGDSILNRFKDVIHKQLSRTENMDL